MRHRHSTNMARKIKKGTRGTATAYISRTKAVRKLQLSLQDFRRLCILKGIFPRQPPKTKKLKSGPTATYYYAKDIQYLAHEPLLNKYRDFKVFLRRLKRAVARKDKGLAVKLEENAPVYTVDHLVKERYPTFTDALRDLDDALCMVFLFRALPRSSKVKGEIVDQCETLALHFMKYVALSGSLRKVFLSIKGIYYQAEIMGQRITWVVPYSFSQRIPNDVDFRVMLTFLEFWTTMLGFVNYKLYTLMDLAYPPQLNATHTARGEGLSAIEAHTSAAAKALQEKEAGSDIQTETDTQKSRDKETDVKKQHEEQKLVAQKVSEVLKTIGDEVNEAEEEVDVPQLDKVQLDHFEAEGPGADYLEGAKEALEIEKTEDTYKRLFSNCHIFVSRETPIESLEFVITSLGGKVTLDSPANGGGADKSITHHIVDRPVISEKVQGRVYVQPQWVYDSVNAKMLLPEESYAPGAILPPHLSPFVVVKASSYDARKPLQIQSPNVEDEDTDEEATFAKDLEEERQGLSTAQTGTGTIKKKKRAANKAAEQQSAKELAKIVMPKKHRDLLERVERRRKKKKAAVARLEKRRAEYEASQPQQAKRQRT